MITYFGEKLDGILYKTRKGVYAIIENEKQQIGLVKTPGGYFLPGGGVEVGEDHMTA